MSKHERQLYRDLTGVAPWSRWREARWWVGRALSPWTWQA